MILSIAFLYPGSCSNLPIYFNRLGNCVSVRIGVLPLAAISGKLSSISAPVKDGPHRYSPARGLERSCDSRKAKWVSRFGFMNESYIDDAIRFVINRMKKGTGAVLIPVYKNMLARYGGHY